MAVHPQDPVAATRCALAASQRVVLALGAILCGLYALALVAGELGRRSDVEDFSQAPQRPDQSLWSQTRVQEFLASQGLPVSEPVGVLRAPSLNLIVPIYPDSSELHLNRGAGLIQGMSAPDEGGNLGVAGHRDGYFRALKNVRRDDVLEVQTRSRRHRYRVVSVDVVDPSDRRLLADTEEPTITLVTCYPFYYLGHAPLRFIVRGTYLWSAPKIARDL
jgi:sortase A